MKTLEYLNKENILNECLQPYNILVNQDQIKIIDYGLNFLENIRQDNSSFILNNYMSPEYYEKILHKKNNQIDSILSNIFSFGLIILKSINKLAENDMNNFNSNEDDLKE